MVAQVITIVNQSGKVVKTSKHLVNVFNEAKSAYNERKAELKAVRDRQQESKTNERKALKQLEALTIADDDTKSQRSSRRGSSVGGKSVKRKPVPERSERPPIERGYSDSFYANDKPEQSKKSTHKASPLRFTENGSLVEDRPRMNELVRRHTSGMEQHKSGNDAQTITPSRSASLDDIDMDLAYGELPPPLPDRRGHDEVELREKMSGLQRLLDECNCVQHSVTATIDNLQKNPDALAAVALTLAEISNLVSKLPLGSLGMLKGAFPVIIGLLASPEFAIAAGVGIGVTIIAFGGYKIIKKIKARKEELLLETSGAALDNNARFIEDEPVSAEENMDELREIDRVELWRRGIADAQVESIGTSVDGEFVTPAATRTLIEEGRLTEADLKSTTSSRRSKKHHSGSKSEAGKSEAGKSESGKSSKSKSKVGTKTKKEKEPSGLKMLFKGRSHVMA